MCSDLLGGLRGGRAGDVRAIGGEFVNGHCCGGEQHIRHRRMYSVQSNQYLLPAVIDRSNP